MKASKEKTKEPEIIKNQISSLPFSKGNYTVMIIGILLIITGFIIMSLDKEEFGFGFLGLTLGPVITFLGFMVEIYAVLKK